jgi:predicted NBD/HSP70 family sugar kinase
MLVEERIASRNAKQIYASIRRQGTMSKLDLMQASGLTGSTLTRILDELTAQGLLEEVGFGESTGGRRPILYQTNATYGYALGLDISRTYSKLVLTDLHLRKLQSHTWVMDAAMTPDRLIHEAAAKAQEMIAAQGIPADQVLGLGIGAVGPLDRMNGVFIDPLNFPSEGWQGYEINRIAGEQFHLPIVLDNGANAAILGEYWNAAGEQLEHLLYLHIGVGIRTSMIVGGSIVYGAIDTEGAIGQMIIQADGLPSRQRSGNYGALESYATTYSIEQAAKSQLKLGRASLLRDQVTRIEDLSYPLIESCLEQGDELTRELFVNAASYCGIGLANLLNILHPQKVILGGPLISGNDVFFNHAIDVALQKMYASSVYQVLFEKSKLGDDAVMLGAAATLINRLTE